MDKACQTTLEYYLRSRQRCHRTHVPKIVYCPLINMSTWMSNGFTISVLLQCSSLNITTSCSLPQLHQVLVQLQSGDKEQDFSLAPIQVSISVQLWRLPGCHEFLAALGESSIDWTHFGLEFKTLPTQRYIMTECPNSTGFYGCQKHNWWMIIMNGSLLYL